MQDPIALEIGRGLKVKAGGSVVRGEHSNYFIDELSKEFAEQLMPVWGLEHENVSKNPIFDVSGARQRVIEQTARTSIKARETETLKYTEDEIEYVIEGMMRLMKARIDKHNLRVLEEEGRLLKEESDAEQRRFEEQRQRPPLRDYDSIKMGEVYGFRTKAGPDGKYSGSAVALNTVKDFRDDYAKTAILYFFGEKPGYRPQGVRYMSMMELVRNMEHNMIFKVTEYEQDEEVKLISDAKLTKAADALRKKFEEQKAYYQIPDFDLSPVYEYDETDISDAKLREAAGALKKEFEEKKAHYDQVADCDLSPVDEVRSTVETIGNMISGPYNKWTNPFLWAAPFFAKASSSLIGAVDEDLSRSSGTVSAVEHSPESKHLIDGAVRVVLGPVEDANAK